MGQAAAIMPSDMTAQGRCSLGPPRWGRLLLFTPPDVADAALGPTDEVVTLLIRLHWTGVPCDPGPCGLESCLVQDSVVAAARGSAARPLQAGDVRCCPSSLRPCSCEGRFTLVMQVMLYGADPNSVVQPEQIVKSLCCILPGVSSSWPQHGLHARVCVCRRLVLPPYCVKYEPPRTAQNPVTRGVQEGVRQFIALGNRIKGRARRRGKARWAAGAWCCIGLLLGQLQDVAEASGLLCCEPLLLLCPEACASTGAC